MTESLDFLGVKANGVTLFANLRKLIEEDNNLIEQVLVSDNIYTYEILESVTLSNLFQEFIIFVRREHPPELTARYDGSPIGILIPKTLFTQIGWEKFILNKPEEIFFHLVNSATFSVPPVQIRVLQIPEAKPNDYVFKRRQASIDIIIPHYGSKYLLECTLRHLTRQQGVNLKIFIGLDAYNAEQGISYSDQKSHIYGFTGGPYGPYFIDDYLIDKGTSEVIFFQDSDDISCSDRFNVIMSSFNLLDAQYIGSHEVRLDEINRRISLFRFPLDVNKALSNTPRHALLHPTSSIFRQDYKKLGGFSTDRRFGLDYEFLLRAFFEVSIMNVDEFLYIRRSRKNSLTTAKSTGLNSSLRLQYTKIMKDAFHDVNSGRIRIEASNICARKLSKEVSVKKLNLPFQ